MITCCRRLPLRVAKVSQPGKFNADRHSRRKVVKRIFATAVSLSYSQFMIRTIDHCYFDVPDRILRRRVLHLPGDRCGCRSNWNIEGQYDRSERWAHPSVIPHGFSTQKTEEFLSASNQLALPTWITRRRKLVRRYFSIPGSSHSM